MELPDSHSIDARYLKLEEMLVGELVDFNHDKRRIADVRLHLADPPCRMKQIRTLLRRISSSLDVCTFALHAPLAAGVGPGEVGNGNDEEAMKKIYIST